MGEPGAESGADLPAIWRCGSLRGTRRKFPEEQLFVRE